MEDFAGCRRARELRRAAARWPPRSRRCARSPFVEYERVSALKLRFLKLLFVAVPARAAARLGARAGVRRFLEREGDLLERFATYCALDEHLHRRDPGGVGLDRNGRRRIQDPGSAGNARLPAKALAPRDVLPVPAMADRHAAAGARSSARATAAFPSACTTTWRWPRTASARTCGPTARSSSPGCRVGSPPDDFSPQARTGRFRRPTPSGTARTATGCSPNPSARTAATAARCASTTSCACSGCTGFRTGSTPPQGAYVRERSEDFVRILALESVRNHVVVVGEDLGTVEPDDARNAGPLRHAQLPPVLFREEPGRRVPPPRGVPARRRWSPPPPTTCPPWRASGWGPICGRAATRACSTKPASGSKAKRACARNRRCWTCCSRRG